MMILNPTRPRRLVLMWRPPVTQPDRTHFPVGELVRDRTGKVAFCYLSPEELARARQAGFSGYPAFPLEADAPKDDVLDVFARRLPPEKRGDYTAYLGEFALPPDSRPDAFQLLAFSQGAVPGDPFYFVDPLSDANPPFDFLCDVRGTRHYPSSAPLPIGTELFLKTEPKNRHDSEAIRIDSPSGPIGYLPRIQAPAIGALLSTGVPIFARVFKVNGTPDDPRIKVLVNVGGSRQVAA